MAKKAQTFPEFLAGLVVNCTDGEIHWRQVTVVQWKEAQRLRAALEQVLHEVDMVRVYELAHEALDPETYGVGS